MCQMYISDYSFAMERYHRVTPSTTVFWYIMSLDECLYEDHENWHNKVTMVTDKT